MTESNERPPVLDLLSEVHRLLEAPSGLEELLSEVAQLLVERYRANAAAIQVVADDAVSTTVTAGAPWPDDITFAPPSDLPASGSVGEGAYTSIPGRAGGALRAVLHVWTSDVPEGDARRVLDLVAEHAALAVADAESRRGLDTTVRQLTVLHAYAGELQRSSSPKSVADALVRAVHEGLGFPRAIMFLRVREKMEAYASAGVAFEDVRHLVVPLDEPGLVHDVVEAREPIVVRDPKSDPRMRPGYAAVPENPNALVVVPLVAPGGEVVGVLAVDDAGLERQMSRELLEALVVFVEQAVLALRNAELVEDRARFSATLEALVGATDAGIMLVSPGPDARLVFANQRVEEILGIPLRSRLGAPAAELVETMGKVRFRDPEALAARFRAGMADATATIRDRFELVDGRIVERYSTPSRDGAGGTLGRVTVYRDVTDRERLIEELTGLAEISSVFATGAGLEDMLTRVQAVVARLLRVDKVTVSRNDPARTRFLMYRPTHGFSKEFEEVAAESRYDVRDPLTSELLAGRPIVLDAATGAADEGIERLRGLFSQIGGPSIAAVPLQVQGHVTGSMSVWDEDHSRVFTERDVRMLSVLASQLAPFLRNAELVRDRLELAEAVRDVDRAAAEIVAADTVEEIAARAVRAVIEELGLSLSRIWILEEDGTMRVGASSGDHPDAALATAVPSPPVEVILETLERFVTDDPASAGVDRRWLNVEGMVAFAGFPLVLGSEVLGVLTGYSRHPIRNEIVDLMGSVATYAAAAIGKTRAFDRERMIARTLQEGLIPGAVAPLEGLSIAARYFSATSGAEVGGDLYDVFPMDGRHVLFIADVSGKGVAAASTAGLVRHSLRALCTRDSEGPRIMQYLNRTVLEGGGGQFVTALLGTFEVETGRLWMTAAGHPPPLLRRRDGTVQELEARGPALGLFLGSEYHAIPIDLHPGDALVMYTDGIAECRSGHDMYGAERVAASVAVAPREATADQLVDAVVEAAEAFCGGSFGDDVAVLAVRVEARD